MIVPYTAFPSRNPFPTLGGRFTMPRSAMAVRIFGPTGSSLEDGLLDTGSDETVFPTHIAAKVGIDLSQVPIRKVHLAGRGIVPCRNVAVRLRITDGFHETYEWTTLVAFTPIPLVRALLGYAGFLQYFDANFRGADEEVILFPNGSFPGQVP